MSYCPFCGEKINDGGRCTGCGYTPDSTGSSAGNSPFGTEKSSYEIPLWLKIVIIIAMFMLSGGSIIGIIAGAVLSTSKDPKFKSYGKWLLKTALIVLVAKVILTIVVFILITVIGVTGAVFMSVPEYTGALTWLA